MRVAIIDDEPTAGESLKEVIEGEQEDAIVKVFETVYDAQDWPADFAIIDVSAMTFMVGRERHAYAVVASYLERHPGVQVIIISGLPQHYFQKIVDQVREVVPGALVECRSTLRDMDWVKHLGESL